jgi:hypothetical protein
LKRAIQKYLENTLAQEILTGTFQAGDIIEVDMGAGGQIGFRKKPGARHPTTGDSDGPPKGERPSRAQA